MRATASTEGTASQTTGSWAGHGHRGILRSPAARYEDGTLVVRALDGDDWAREALFRRYVEPVTRMVTRMLARTGDADDVVQDAFAEALRDLHKLRDPESFRGWLFRIAVNRARKSLRRRKLQRVFGLDQGVDDAALERLAASDIGPEDVTELKKIDEVLATLPAHQRLSWMLRHVEGETLEEVAMLTGCSLATAKRRIKAAEDQVAAVTGGGPS